MDQVLTTIINGIDGLIQAFLNTPTETIVLVLGAGGVSALTQVSKKLLKLKNDKAIVSLLMAISFVASMIDYVVTNTSNLPPSILGINTAVLAGLAHPLYYFLVKPADRVIGEFRQYKDDMKAKVEDIEAVNTVATIEQEAAPATPADPATVPPTPAAVPGIADF